MDWTLLESGTIEGFSELSLPVDEDKLFPNFFFFILVIFSLSFGGTENK